VSAYWPFIASGVFAGSLYGLAAMGMVLTYKTVGVFNFAYGAMAMFSAFTYWELHDNWGLTAWVAMPILFLLVAPFMGVVLEGLFRPLSGAPTEVLIVVSLGVLAALQALAPIAYGSYDRQLLPIIPLSTFQVGAHFHVGWDQLGTLLISLMMAGALWALLRRTRFGTSTRAVVDNPDLSDMIGIHGDQVRRTAWILSAVFAALVGVLISPTQTLDFNQLILVVIYAFAPAVLGILFGLPAAYIGGIVLGVAVSIVSKFSTSSLTATDFEAALPYLAMFLLLVVFGNRLKEAGATGRRLAVARISSGAATVKRAAWSVGRVRVDRNVVAGTGGLVLALLVPLVIPGPRLYEVTFGFAYALIALTLVVLTGWAGQISLAQYSFVGVGAFTAGHLAGAHGQHFLFAMLMGMLFAAPLGIVVGLVSLRLSGLYLALATLAFALVMDAIVFNRNDVSGGLTGITVPRPQIFGLSFTGRASLYELVVAIFAVFAFGAYALRLGPVGRRLNILRDSPLAASTLGVNLTVTKLVVFVVCGMVAALGGSLVGTLQQAITPQDFMWSTSLQLLLLIVLGGRSVLSGALIAGAVYAVQLLPGIPANVHKVIPLAIAIGVIGLAQEPEGTVALTRRQTRFTLAVLRPLPHTPGAEELDRAHEVATSHAA
jgi:branched-chain amino acid transport system permease protein